MQFDDPDAVIRISMEIEDHVEQSHDKAVYEGGWNEGEKADIGWCVGVHVADVLQRLFGDGHRLEEAYRAVIMCIKEHRYAIERRSETK